MLVKPPSKQIKWLTKVSEVFYLAPKILGGAKALRGVAGEGVGRLEDVIELTEIEWSRIGSDLMLRALVKSR